jgi:hypothetical protein
MERTKDDVGKYWMINSKVYYRNHDLPAFVYTNMIKQWFNGKWHRERDLPSFIFGDGTKQWISDDLTHRENDLPAFISFEGIKQWYKNGIKIK